MMLTQEDKIVSEFLKSLGPWRDLVVIGGGFALFIYKLYLKATSKVASDISETTLSLDGASFSN